jgi:hypothetical protein
VAPQFVAGLRNEFNEPFNLPESLRIQHAVSFRLKQLSGLFPHRFRTVRPSPKMNRKPVIVPEVQLGKGGAVTSSEDLPGSWKFLQSREDTQSRESGQGISG